MQPAMTADGDVLIGSGSGMSSGVGVRRLAVAHGAAGEFTEIARVPAVEGKTWNHPVLVGDVLLVRNDQEMVAFRLSSRTADGRGSQEPGTGRLAR